MDHSVIPAPDRLAGIQKRRWTLLMRNLDDRQHEDDIYTHAYVTPMEAVWLQGWRLRQPGHTRYRYSTSSEDLSDIAQQEGA